jgi:hypothetical protein
MRIYSGVPRFSKREVLAIKTLLEHARRDLNYMADGTYIDHEKSGSENVLDKKAHKLGSEGVEHVQFLLDYYSEA